jgi:hypothetical protein
MFRTPPIAASGGILLSQPFSLVTLECYCAISAIFVRHRSQTGVEAAELGRVKQSYIEVLEGLLGYFFCWVNWGANIALDGTKECQVVVIVRKESGGGDWKLLPSQC